MSGKCARGTFRVTSMLVLAACALGCPALPAIAAPPTGDLYGAPDLAKLQRSFEKLASNVAATVVAIETYRRVSLGDDQWVLNSQGSGFVYSADGLFVTNHHVVDGADRIEVTLLGGKKLAAEIVQYDPRSDLAVLRVDAHDLRVAPLGDLDNVRVGQWVFTAGNPFGLAMRDGQPSVSFGLVEAIGRNLSAQLRRDGMDRYYGNLIETRASVNPGNSGGPLFDIEGRVVGVSTAMISDSGVDEGRGFAIPISRRTRRILETLAGGNVVRYGYLGVQIEDLTTERARTLGVPLERGAVVRGFADDAPTGPAERAGLQPRDVIAEFDGTPVSGADDLIRVVGGTPVGNEVQVVYYRQARRLTATVKLSERLETVAAREKTQRPPDQVRHMEWRGLVLVEPTDALLSAHDLTREDAGLFVFDVPRGNVFYRRGLRKNTMIMRLNGKRIRALDELLAREKEVDGALRLELADGTTIVVPP